MKIRPWSCSAPYSRAAHQTPHNDIAGPAEIAHFRRSPHRTGASPATSGTEPEALVAGIERTIRGQLRATDFHPATRIQPGLPRPVKLCGTLGPPAQSSAFRPVAMSQSGTFKTLVATCPEAPQKAWLYSQPCGSPSRASADSWYRRRRRMHCRRSEANAEHPIAPRTRYRSCPPGGRLPSLRRWFLFSINAFQVEAEQLPVTPPICSSREGSVCRSAPRDRTSAVLRSAGAVRTPSRKPPFAWRTPNLIARLSAEGMRSMRAGKTQPMPTRKPVLLETVARGPAQLPDPRFVANGLEPLYRVSR